jgi:hypothetical protein
MNNEEKKALDPIMVKNPLTNRFINIAPLFEVAEGWFEGFGDMADSVDKSIELMTCYKNEASEADNITFVGNIAALFQIRNTLRNITEFTEDRRH